MAPKASSSKNSPSKAASPDEGQAGGQVTSAPARQVQVSELQAYTREVAVVQFFYVLLRAVWHAGLPTYLGGPQYVPLAAELFAVESALLLLFWGAGGFAGPSQQRHWMLNIYNLLAMAVISKCITDLYLYSLAPHMWKHYRPGMPWGIPALLASKLPQSVVTLGGMQPATFVKACQYFERGLELFGIWTGWKGVRAGKALMLLLRAETKEASQKKND